MSETPIATEDRKSGRDPEPRVERVPVSVRNGSGSGYDATVEPVRHHSRKEVESLLQSRTESISTRLAALQQEVADTGTSVKNAVTNNAWLGVVAALAGGLLIGRILTRGNRRGDNDEIDGGDAKSLAELLTRSVRSAIDEGIDPTPSVQAVLTGLTAGQGSGETTSAPPRKKHGLGRAIGFALLELAIRRAVSEFTPRIPDEGSPERH
jgi:hypothetical protein